MCEGCGGVRAGREAPEARGPIAGPRAAAEPRLSQYGKFSPGEMTEAMDARHGGISMPARASAPGSLRQMEPRRKDDRLHMRLSIAHGTSATLV